MALSKEEKLKRAEERRLIEYNKTHKEVDGITYKWCNHHKELFPDEDEWFPCTEEYFYPNKSSLIDGLNTYCKKCSKKRASKWRLDNVEKARASCRKSVQRPEVREYHRKDSQRRVKEGLSKEWQRKNPGKMKSYWENRKHKEHQMSKKEWESCLKYFDYKCAYCGMSLEDHKKIYKKQLHKEHVIDCGRNDLKNCVPSCQICNSEKGSLSLNDWYNSNNIKYTYERYHKICQWIRYDCKKYIMKKKPKKKYTKKNKEYWEDKREYLKNKN